MIPIDYDAPYVLVKNPENIQYIEYRTGNKINTVRVASFVFEVKEGRTRRLVVQEKLGAGAFGVVYKAHDDDNTYAVKVIKGLEKNEADLVREAHENIRSVAKKYNGYIAKVYECYEYQKKTKKKLYIVAVCAIYAD